MSLKVVVMKMPLLVKEFVPQPELLLAQILWTEMFTWLSISTTMQKICGGMSYY
jgi:hypothetical protein